MNTSWGYQPARFNQLWSDTKNVPPLLLARPFLCHQSAHDTHTTCGHPLLFCNANVTFVRTSEITISPWPGNNSFSKLSQNMPVNCSVRMSGKSWGEAIKAVWTCCSWICIVLLVTQGQNSALTSRQKTYGCTWIIDLLARTLRHVLFRVSQVRDVTLL